MGRIFGYARVSTVDQSLDLQTDALIDAGCERRDIYTDTASGVKSSRPGFDAMMRLLEPGDTVVVWKLDRIGRSLTHLVSFIDELNERGVAFRCLSNGFLDTTTAEGRLLFSICAAFAEFEHDLIVERTNAGLKAARARGRSGGRPKKDPQAVEQAIVLYRTGQVSLKDIQTMTGVSPSTLYKYLGMEKKTAPTGGQADGSRDAGDASPQIAE